MIICISGFVVGSPPHNFSFPPLPNPPSDDSIKRSSISSLTSSFDQIQLRSVDPMPRPSPTIEQISSRSSSLEQIQTRSSSVEQIHYSPSPIPVCCRTPTKSIAKTGAKPRVKKVSFRLDQLPQRRPQTTV